MYILYIHTYIYILYYCKVLHTINILPCKLVIARNIVYNKFNKNKYE